ncbi:MAG: hypothetical protein WB609_00605 [Candidatus Cybelea sp.]
MTPLAGTAPSGAWTFVLIAAVSLGLVLVVAAIVGALTSLVARAQGQSGMGGREARPVVWTFGLATFTLFGLVAIPFITGLSTSTWIQLELIAVGLFVVGGFFGFLFGLPTATQPSQSTTDSRPLLSVNTHLEDVTSKIATLLTGVALAQIITVPTYILAFNTELQTALGTSAGAMGIALLLYFPPLGFILTYVVMRVGVSELFARADQRLQLFVSGQSAIRRAPPLPDISEPATPDQLAIARSIASIPYAAITDVNDKATWARANALLNNYADAERAFQDVRVLDPRNYYALIDYATVIYNDPNIDDVPYVLSLLATAQSLCPADKLDTLARIKSLRAAALLYQTGGYEASIEEINSLIATINMPQPKLARFYRACGFGQLFAALQAGGAIPAPVQTAIEGIILNDSALTLAQGKMGRDQLLCVAAGIGRQNASDNDLQAFAAIDVPFQLQLQTPAPAPPPPPPPPPPATITAAAIAGGWIATHCPP